MNCQFNVRNIRVVHTDAGQRALSSQTHRTNTNWSENNTHSDERKAGAQTWSSRMIGTFIEFNFARGSGYTTLFQSHQRVKPALGRVWRTRASVARRLREVTGSHFPRRPTNSRRRHNHHLLGSDHSPSIPTSVVRLTTSRSTVNRTSFLLTFV